MSITLGASIMTRKITVSWVEVFERLPESVRGKLMDATKALEKAGSDANRPLVDTLKGSKLKNLKEIRFRDSGGEWRFAFIFDPLRNAVILVAGNKSGANQKRFYSTLISVAEKRYKQYLENQ